jgi:hypothetical protein
MAKNFIAFNACITLILAGCSTQEILKTKQCWFNAEEETFMCSIVSTGKIFYVGEMKYINNIYYKDGIGTEYFSTGAIYKGGWKMGNRSGQGTHTVTDQTICSSNWLNDRQNGIVSCLYSGEYAGHMREGLTDGAGTWVGRTVYTFPNSKKVEEFWENGKLVQQRDILKSSSKIEDEAE